ncbi:hypothetical protein M0804_009834 [Polistes exclamans]|nr:hypothetical protein M0804_009834 [Polistes exclamans]
MKYQKVQVLKILFTRERQRIENSKRKYTTGHLIHQDEIETRLLVLYTEQYYSLLSIKEDEEEEQEQEEQEEQEQEQEEQEQE